MPVLAGGVGGSGSCGVAELRKTPKEFAQGLCRFFCDPLEVSQHNVYTIVPSGHVVNVCVNANLVVARVGPSCKCCVGGLRRLKQTSVAAKKLAPPLPRWMVSFPPPVVWCAIVPGGPGWAGLGI